MSAKKQTVKYIIYCLIILGCDLLQNVQGLFPEVWGARCFLLLPVTIILAMGEDEKKHIIIMKMQLKPICTPEVKSHKSPAKKCLKE